MRGRNTELCWQGASYLSDAPKSEQERTSLHHLIERLDRILEVFYYQDLPGRHPKRSESNQGTWNTDGRLRCFGQEGE